MKFLADSCSSPLGFINVKCALVSKFFNLLQILFYELLKNQKIVKRVHFYKKVSRSYYAISLYPLVNRIHDMLQISGL